MNRYGQPEYLGKNIADGRQKIADFPQAGTRELVVHRNYILVYDVAGDVVRILRVLHARREWPPVTDMVDQTQSSAE